MSEEKKAAVEKLKLLIENARELRQWLFHPYQDIWMTPTELAREVQNGHYLWSGWEIKDPRERILQLKNEVNRAVDALSDFTQRVKSDA